MALGIESGQPRDHELPPVLRTPGVRWPAASRKDVVYACPTPCRVPPAGGRVGPDRGQTGRRPGEGSWYQRVVLTQLDGPGRRRRRRPGGPVDHSGEEGTRRAAPA